MILLVVGACIGIGGGRIRCRGSYDVIRGELTALNYSLIKVERVLKPTLSIKLLHVHMAMWILLDRSLAPCTTTLYLTRTPAFIAYNQTQCSWVLDPS